MIEQILQKLTDYQRQQAIEEISMVLNNTNAYNEISKKLCVELDGDSIIFREIEEFILDKLTEMQEINYETKKDRFF